MKQIIKLTFIAFAVVFAMTACAPQEFDDYQLGESYSISADQVSFDMTPGSDPWTYNYTMIVNVDPVKYPYSYEIIFGDGQSTKDPNERPNGRMSGSHEYIVAKGIYTAKCSVYTPNGESVIKDVVITIAEDNEKIYKDDPASLQFALTGGKDNVEGKVWYIGDWTAMRDPSNLANVWWDFKNDATANDAFTFKPNSIQPNGAFAYDNNGDTHMNESLGSLFPDGNIAGSFVTVNYTPATDATWNITERSGKKYLTINKGFLGYAIAPSDLQGREYEVISYTTSNIRLMVNTGVGWCYELVSEVPDDPLTNNDSKTWVYDANNKHLQEVKDALPALAGNLKGHIGLDALNTYDQAWWGAGPQEKSYDNTLASQGKGWTLYDWKMTFTSAGQLNIVTAGEGYGRKACASAGGFTPNTTQNDDIIFDYTGGNYTYTLDKNATPYPKLTLSGNAFLGYYCGTQEYEIIYLSESAMCVVAHNTIESQDWVFILCPDGEQ